MRLEACMKGGFYPAPISALDLVAARLKAPEGATILDPCAGEGVAVGYLATKLGIKPPCVYAVELEEGRSVAATAALPGSRVIAPADFLQTDISANSLSMVWCNPPFDNEIGGGGRVEYGFLEKAIRLTATKGVVALVCPEMVMSRNEMRELCLQNLDNLSVTPFPAADRKFTEVVVLGTKRPRAVMLYSGNWMSAIEKNRGIVYTLPPASGPRRFVKSGLTDAEILRGIAASPLNSVFVGTRAFEMPSPPLELSRGQLALVLAGGLLNTTLQRPGEDPILIKATPFKETYISSETQELKDEGTEKEDLVKTVITSERIKLKVRVMTSDATIHDLT
jgi:predicted RNA methylase